MIPKWKMNGKDMRFDGSIEIGVVEVRDLFDDLVVTLWVDQEESGSIAVKTLGGIGNGRYSVQIFISNDSVPSMSKSSKPSMALSSATIMSFPFVI